MNLDLNHSLILAHAWPKHGPESELQNVWKTVTVLFLELKTIIPLYPVHGLKNNTVFSECICIHSLDNYDFYAQYRMCSTKLRNHLKAINQYLLYFKALHVICYWECLATMISNRLVQIAVAPFFVHLECYVT